MTIVSEKSLLSVTYSSGLSAYLYGHEQPIVATLNQQRELLVIAQEAAKLLHAFHRLTIDTEQNVTLLDASSRCRALRAFDDEPTGDATLLALLRRERAKREPKLSL